MWLLLSLDAKSKIHVVETFHLLDPTNHKSHHPVPFPSISIRSFIMRPRITNVAVWQPDGVPVQRQARALPGPIESNIQFVRWGRIGNVLINAPARTERVQHLLRITNEQTRHYKHQAENRTIRAKL
jgi:hypothetical protein